ncbi:DEAD/DEAH box helicase [Oryzobacter telluris]|uniref:DEAD/DEAH box helicase n=1 Tax=Oryzobacter telluris TaxID=3149179 RepID=UPI00370D8F8A
MPKKASGPKKARWTTSQKSEARKGPKKAHHRGQPDGPKSAPKRAARSDSAEGHTKRPRAERSPRWDREDPRRQSGPGRPAREDSRGSSSTRGDDRNPRYSAGRSDRGTTSYREDRNDRPKRWVSDSREERNVHRPHDERPRLERGERPVRDRAPRVADPARRDRHEGRHADRTGDRGGYQQRDDRSSDRGGYQKRDDRGGYQGRDAGSSDRGGYQGRSTGSSDRGGYQKRDDRGGYQGRDAGSSDRGGYQGRSTGSSDRGGFQQRDDRGAPQQRDTRGGYQGRDDRSSDRGGYQKRDDRGGYQGRSAGSSDRGGYQGRSAGSSDRGGYQGRDTRGGYQGRDDRGAQRGASDGAVSFEEAEALRSEADTWTTYTSTAGEAKEVTEDNGFAALGVPAVLVERLARDGIADPFPIQAATIPDALAGRDVLGRGRTGSGKTLAFGLSMITRLADGTRPEPKRPRSLILVPTRELAMQVSDALEPFVHVTGLRHKLVAGGLSYEPQIKALAKGLDILVATPGRLADLMERGAVDLGGVQIAVLDEADHMADMGFLPEVTAILDTVPAGGQRLLFSATLDKGIDTLVERYLVDPVTHSTDDAQASVTTMSHHVLLIDPQDKKAMTAELAGRGGRVIVFARTQLGSDRIAGELRDRGVLAASLHGGLSQNVRNRVLGAFRDGSMNVLVATDVAARGIHVDDVGMVVQVDPPTDHKDYLHRAGRTARAGEEGAVVMLALPHQRKMVTRIIEGAGAEALTAKVAPGDATVQAMGGRAPSGVPVPDHVWRPILEGKPQARRGGRPGGPRGGRPGGSYGRPDGGPRREGRGQGSGRPGGYRGRMDG